MSLERDFNCRQSNICRRLVEEALTGNIQAIKLILDRVLPSRRDRVIDVQLPILNTADDALKAMSIIIEAIGRGNITPSEGEALSRIIDAFVKTIQTHEIKKRAVANEIWSGSPNFTFYEFIEDYAINLIGDAWWIEQEEEIAKDEQNAMFLFADYYQRHKHQILL